MSFSVIIPARFASTRLPGKPLQMINNKPMVQHVYERACKSEAKQVVVATDDQRIVDAVNQFGGQVCLTQASHESGTDRLQEVAEILALNPDEIVVNVQGDEPLIPPAVINQVAKNLADNIKASVATLSEPINLIADLQNPNIVKAVSNNMGMALYFSRAPIPYARDGWDDLFNDNIPKPQRHIGIYAYRVSLLHKFVKWPQSSLEKIECLEQLRIIDNGHHIHIAQASELVPGGVDTPEDLIKVQDLVASMSHHSE